MNSKWIVPRRNSKWSAAAIAHILRKRIARMQTPPLSNFAVKSWKIAPAEESISPPAFFLPQQLERVTGWMFAHEHPRRAMSGGSVVHAATRAYLLKDVSLIDGALYKEGAYTWLTPRTKALPTVHMESEVERGALFCTAMGNKYFGQWLMDDCVTYPLAFEEGIPVTTAQKINFHTQGYETLLNMNPVRLNNTYFRELVIFDDVGQNQHKGKRFRAMSKQLLTHVEGRSHPGVFILRGGAGELRILHNEMALAEYLQKKRGFRVLDPSTENVQTIVDICAGAATVVGVEGSGLMHGILGLRKGGSVLTLQPPNRFVSVYKDLTDRDSQHFGFVVGHARGEGFYIDPDEVEQTLDLFPTSG